jgi:hypothetical protein
MKYRHEGHVLQQWHQRCGALGIGLCTDYVEQKSRANFAPEFKLPLSKLTATDNIML